MIGLLYSNNDFSLYRLGPDVLYARFKKSVAHNLTLIRAASFYESPVFRRRKKIRRRELNAWYRRSKRNKGCEPTWAGFNIPRPFLTSFISGHRKILSKKEQLFFAQVKKESFRYLVTSCEENYGDHKILEHELSHALFFLDEHYRALVGHVVKKLPQRQENRRLLGKMGYARPVMVDEVGAYLLSPLWINYLLTSARQKKINQRHLKIYHEKSCVLRRFLHKRLSERLFFPQDLLDILASHEYAFTRSKALSDYLSSRL